MIECLKDILKDEDLLNAPKVLRTHCYCQPPYIYDISCLLCGTSNITWSEYEGHIWCYECERDIMLIHRYAGIFGGPIPVELSKMMGIYFDRIGMNGSVIKDDGRFTDEYNATWVINKELKDYEIKLDQILDASYEKAQNVKEV